MFKYQTHRRLFEDKMNIYHENMYNAKTINIYYKKENMNY